MSRAAQGLALVVAVAATAAPTRMQESAGVAVNAVRYYRPSGAQTLVDVFCRVPLVLVGPVGNEGSGGRYRIDGVGGGGAGGGAAGSVGAASGRGAAGGAGGAGRGGGGHGEPPRDIRGDRVPDARHRGGGRATGGPVRRDVGAAAGRVVRAADLPDERGRAGGVFLALGRGAAVVWRA